MNFWSVRNVQKYYISINPDVALGALRRSHLNTSMALRPMESFISTAKKSVIFLQFSHT